MDQGHYQPYGPFEAEAEAQAWADQQNANLPINTEKWEHHVLPLLPPK